jgi:4-methylaminobutanoate oxidase (formaldehyde-forming)
MKPTGLIGLVRYGADLYSRLEKETGQSVGWRNCGYVKVARTRARFEEYKRSVSVFNALGGAAVVIDRDRVRELWPLAKVDDLVGAVWEPGSGRVDPTGLVMAYAKGARARGVLIIENCSVTGFLSDKGRVTGVETNRGVVSCDAVVNCAGIWARQIGKLAGVNVPLHATEHFYMLTKPIKGIHRNLPILNDPDGNIYIREDLGGLLVGCFEPDAKSLPLSKLPEEFSFGQLEPDWDHVEPYMQNAMTRIPALEDAEVRLLMNGPESFTPDGNLLVGEVPELESFYVLAGLNSGGVAMSAGMGRIISEWVIDGGPSVDMTRFDIRRFGDIHDNTAWLGIRVGEIVGRHMAVPIPGKDYSTGRPQRLSPFHGFMKSKGAQFGSLMGWERPLWFGEPEPEFENPFGKPWWLSLSAREHHAAREAVAIFDLSSFAKLLIAGADAQTAAQRIFANNLDIPVGRAVYTSALNEHGGIESDLMVMRLGVEQFMAVTGAAQVTRDASWLRKHKDHSLRVAVVDVSSAYGVLGVMGPRSRDLLVKITDDDVSNEAFPFMDVRSISVGGARVLALRVSYAGELGWELYVPPDLAQEVVQHVWQAGENLGIECAGYHALGSLRMEKAYRSWGRDLLPGTSPAMAGLLFTVDFKKDFVGRAALEKEIRSKPVKRLVQFAVEAGDDWLFGDEPVYRDGEFVGLITSAAFGHTVNRLLAFAYLQLDGGAEREAIAAGRYEVDIGGVRCPAAPVFRPLYDPEGCKLRS